MTTLRTDFGSEAQFCMRVPGIAAAASIHAHETLYRVELAYFDYIIFWTGVRTQGGWLQFGSNPATRLASCHGLARQLIRSPRIGHLHFLSNDALVHMEQSP